MSDARHRRRQKRRRENGRGTSRNVVRDVRATAARRAKPEARKRWPEWLRSSLWGALVFGGILVMFPAGEWLDIQGDTKERAEVLAVRAHSGTDNCHTRGNDAIRPNRAITWRSLNPPAGLDETFVQIEGCRVPEVGEVFTIYRIGGDSENTLMHVDPVDSVDEFLPFAGIGAGAGAVMGVIFLGLERLRDRLTEWCTERPAWWRRMSL